MRGRVEVSREIFDGAKVTIDGSLGVITTLEFFQHHFSKMGHRDLLVTQNLSHPTSNQGSAHLTRSVRRRAASFKSAYRNEAFCQSRLALSVLCARLVSTNPQVLGTIAPPTY